MGDMIPCVFTGFDKKQPEILSEQNFRLRKYDRSEGNGRKAGQIRNSPAGG